MTRDQVQAKLDKITDNHRLLGATLSKVLGTDLIHDRSFLAQIDELKKAMSAFEESIYLHREALDASNKHSRGSRANLRLVKG
ncbi:hypothetical protein BK651_23340 [Pseudomonas rhodesiae]|nr:hypothetical protein BK650_19510 [Pseudomonas rhodesiae]ROM61411.1 hypothetical protein BK651_23340 [Pseudomonas rhodesiae]